MKNFKYALAGVILFLFTITAHANHFSCSDNYIIKEGFWLHKHQAQPRLFLIAVVDTDDETIGKRCEADLDAITETFDDLVDWLGFALAEPKIIKGDEFSKAAVNNAIDKWLAAKQPTQNDIVVFYYSGHGFRYENDASDYPRMWLKTTNDTDVDANNLKVEDVYNRIVQMGAGVNIILSDCCNTTAAGDNGNFDDAAVPVREHVAHKRVPGNAPDEDDNGDKLFIPGHPLSILATAAQKNEYAGGKEDVGGFFTYYLIEALEDCIYDNKIEPTWNNIFKHADKHASYWAKSAACHEANVKHTEEGRCMQTAEFKIE